jgi:acetolactate synthase-1/2/3 large subunit
MAAVTGARDDAPGAMVVDDIAGARAGLAHAAAARAPVIALTFGPEAPAAALGNVLKASLEVTPASTGHWIAHGARVSMTAPRGPVHLHVPAGIADAPAVPVAASCRPSPVEVPTPVALAAAVECLARARRPVVVAGLECRAPGVAPWLRAFVESLPAPVVVTPAAKGALPDPHPLLLGQLVDEADTPAVVALADLVVALGLDAREAAAPAPRGDVPWLWLGPSPQPIGATSVVGDVAAILEELAPRFRDQPRADWDVALLDRLKRASGSSAGAGPSRTMEAAAARIVGLARRLTPAGTVAAAEGGVASAALRAWSSVAPGELVVPAVPTAAPFAVAAAAAVQLGQPDRHVLAFVTADDLSTGDLRMVVRLGVGVVAVLVAGGPEIAEGAPVPEGPRAPEVEGMRVTAVADERAFQEALDRALTRRRAGIVDARAMRTRLA